MPAPSLSIAEAFRTTLDLFDTGLGLMRQNLRRNLPEAGDEEIDRLLRAWLVNQVNDRSLGPGDNVETFRGRFTRRPLRK